MSLTNRVRGVLRQAGVDLIPYSPEKSAAASVARMLQLVGVDLVLDVGANSGQYGAWLRSLGFRGQILSFEPLRDAHAALVERTRRDARWRAAPRVALGAAAGVVTMNVSANSQSSSILPMLDAHVDAAPESKYVAREEVEIARLDQLAAEDVGGSRGTLLKIDTQGYEQAVLEGASGVIPAIAALQLELSIEPLYESQATMCELISCVNDLGFKVYSLWPGYVDPRSGRLLQMDGVFVREAALRAGRTTT
jgi:FkbM family methyltransferase